MSFDGHTLHTMNIHNPYGSIICIRFEGIISAFPSEGKAPLCYFGGKYKRKDLNDKKKTVKKLKHLSFGKTPVPCVHKDVSHPQSAKNH